MTLLQTIQCDGCGKSDSMLEVNQLPIRHEFRNYWTITVKSKWTGELLDFCPECKYKVQEHVEIKNEN